MWVPLLSETSDLSLEHESGIRVEINKVIVRALEHKCRFECCGTNSFNIKGTMKLRGGKNLQVHLWSMVDIPGAYTVKHLEQNIILVKFLFK